MFLLICKVKLNVTLRKFELPVNYPKTEANNHVFNFL